MALNLEDKARLEKILAQIEYEIRDDIMPFWTKDTLDKEFGGFIHQVDNYGYATNDTNKRVVMEARIIWTLAAAHEYGITDCCYLNMARSGFEFIVNHMWDNEYGGFYFEVARDGAPAVTSKSLYANEFVIYAFAQYGRVSGDTRAIEWCGKIYDLIEEKCRDKNRDGYLEDFDRKWNPLPESLGVEGTINSKTVNSHMHLMEALTALVDADHNPKYYNGLAYITDLLLKRAVSSEGYIYEPFDLEWNPKPDAWGRASTFYGHNVEFAWLVLDAYRALKRDREEIKPQVLGAIDHALKYGFDTEKGGIATIGPRIGKVTEHPDYKKDADHKEWWEQAEALVAFIRAYRWTGDTKYLDAFIKEWSWIWKYQIDHNGGDWFADVDWNTGTPLTLDKAIRGWKVCYHNGRSMIMVSRELKELLK